MRVEIEKTYHCEFCDEGYANPEDCAVCEKGCRIIQAMMQNTPERLEGLLQDLNKAAIMKLSTAVIAAVEDIQKNPPRNPEETPPA
jgi:hypothetical protein